MPLPKIDLPLFETKIPSTQKKVKYRPFTVKEEKNLLIAQEAADYDQMVLSIQQLLTNCIVDDIDVDALALFDIEYLLLQIRARSVNNVIEFRIKDPVTGDPVELELDIDKITVEFPEVDYKKIKVTEDYFLTMRYPTMTEIHLIRNLQENGVEKLFNMMIACIDSVVNGDQVYKLSDFNEKEVMEFVDDLPNTAIERIKLFFEKLPNVVYDAQWTTADGEERSVRLEGLDNFFSYR